MTLRSIITISTIVIAALITGCAAPKLSVDQRNSLKKVSIGQTELPEKPTIFGDSAAGAFLFGGPIGLAISNGGSDAPTEFKKSLERSKTDVVAIVREDIRLQLIRNGFEVVADSDAKADAVLVTKVLQYGLTGNIFTSPPVRVPALWIRIDFKKPKTEEIIWSQWASVHITKGILEQLEAKPVVEYFTNAELLNSQFRKASTLVIEAIFVKL
jgi:hypothetical protein